jgi:cell division protein FtsL
MGNEFIAKEEVAEKEKATAQKQRKATAKRARASVFVQILNGEFLARDFVLNNLTFIFFFVFLLIMTVAKGYYAKQLVQDIDSNQKELDATTAEYVESKAKLEEETRRIRLVETLGPRGLKETVNPAKVIRIQKKEN